MFLKDRILSVFNLINSRNFSCIVVLYLNQFTIILSVKIRTNGKKLDYNFYNIPTRVNAPIYEHLWNLLTF